MVIIRYFDTIYRASWTYRSFHMILLLTPLSDPLRLWCVALLHVQLPSVWLTCFRRLAVMGNGGSNSTSDLDCASSCKRLPPLTRAGLSLSATSYVESLEIAIQLGLNEESVRLSLTPSAQRRSDTDESPCHAFAQCSPMQNSVSDRPQLERRSLVADTFHPSRRSYRA